MPRIIFWTFFALTKKHEQCFIWVEGFLFETLSAGNYLLLSFSGKYFPVPPHLVIPVNHLPYSNFLLIPYKKGGSHQFGSILLFQPTDSLLFYQALSIPFVNLNPLVHISSCPCFAWSLRVVLRKGWHWGSILPTENLIYVFLIFKGYDFKRVYPTTFYTSFMLGSPIPWKGNSQKFTERNYFFLFFPLEFHFIFNNAWQGLRIWRTHFLWVTRAKKDHNNDALFSGR